MRLITTIFLNILIIGLIGICAYLSYTVYKSYQEKGVAITDYIQPEYLISLINFNREEEWKTFNSVTFSFEHPASWKPVLMQGNNVFGEAVDLRVPVVFNLPRVGDDTIIGYYRTPVLNRRPENIESESEFVYAGRRGYKWIYKNQSNFFVYEYIIPLQSEITSQQAVSSFTIRVEVLKKDERMENVLDRIANSVKFNQP